MSREQEAAVQQIARRTALDAYLTALLAPRVVRQDLIALAAFQGEIANIPLKITEPLIGEIRLQWWRDAIASSNTGTTTGNPLADAFCKTIERHDLDIARIECMIDAQAQYIYTEPYGEMDHFKSHIDDFDGSAFFLASLILSHAITPPPTDIKAAALSAGRAYGTAKIISQLRAFATRGVWPLPLAPGTHSHVSPHDLIETRGRVDERRASVEYAIKAARPELTTAIRIIATLPNPVKTAFLPLALVEPHFKAFDKEKGDPLMMQIDPSPFRRRFALLRAKLSTLG